MNVIVYFCSHIYNPSARLDMGSPILSCLNAQERSSSQAANAASRGSQGRLRGRRGLLSFHCSKGAGQVSGLLTCALAV